MTYKHKSRWSRIIFLCICLSVVEKGWVAKTHPFEVATSIITPQLLYLVGLACSLMQRDTINSAVDHLFQKEMDRSPQRAPVHENKTTTSACMQQPLSQSSVYTEPVKSIAHHISPTSVHKMDNVVDKAQAVVCYTAHEQVVQAGYHAIPEEVKAVSQELVRHVVLDWNKCIEQNCQETLRHAQAHADNHMLAELRALNPGVTYETHANGGLTCYAPNPIFSLYLGPSRRQHTPSLADDIVERRAQERIQLACDPELRAAVANEFCAFLRNNYCLLYGSLLERIAALLYLADFHIDVIAFGQPLNAIQREIYAEYARKDGSICIDRLADMTDADAIVKKHIAFQKKMASHFEKPCRPVCGVCQNKGKQCEHLRQLRKNSQLIKNKKNVDLQLIRNNHTNQCYRNMLSAFASGDMQEVERIKNSNNSTRGIQTLYEQIRAKYNTLVEQQEALSKDAYGILHFHLPVALQDPLYTTLADGDHARLQSNPSALASFNDALRLRHRYKTSFHKAWNISQDADPVVHQALYALIDSGTIPERIDKVHQVSSNPHLSAAERKKIMQAFFFPNGIMKDFAEYDCAKSLQMPATILGEECAQTRLLLNRLVYTERVCSDEQIKSKCAAAVEYIQKLLGTNDKESAERYLFYVQDMFEQMDSLRKEDLMLLNSEQQPTGNSGQPPQQNQSPEQKDPKNNTPDPSSPGALAVALLEAIDESKEKAIEVFNKTYEWLLSETGLKTVTHCFKDKPHHNFGPLLSRMGGDTTDVWFKIAADVTKKLVDMGTRLPIDSAGIFEEVLVSYEGELVTVQGAVMDGMVKISTMFIKDIHVR